MIEKIEDLNETFYKLFSRVKENREFMTDSEFKFFHEKLFELYKEEHKRLTLENSIDRKNTLYELEQRCDELIPRRRFLFFRNKQMKITDKTLRKEFEEYFRMRSEEEKKTPVNDQERTECEPEQQ